MSYSILVLCNCKEIKEWSVDYGAEWHTEHVESIFMSLLCKLRLIGIMLWIALQQNILIFLGSERFQINLQVDSYDHLISDEIAFTLKLRMSL